MLPYRNPLILAKVIATLDVLSGGRVMCGVGMGWIEQEFEPAADFGVRKTSLMFSVHNRAGELVHALNAFEKYDVNLTMIESRPTKTAAWQYIFYIDVQGHTKDTSVTKAIALLKEHSLFVRVLGSYPDAT